MTTAPLRLHDMAAFDSDTTSRSTFRRAARWLAPLTGVALLGVFSAQALGQSAGPKQISVPSLPTPSVPPTPTLPVPPPPLPTTTTTVSTPVATVPVPAPATPPAPVPATPPAPVPKPGAPSTPSAPATGSAPSGGGSGPTGTASDSPSASGSASARDGASASGSGADDGGKARTAPRLSALRAKPERFQPSSKSVRRGTILVFRLSRPAQLLFTIYGPGPSCERLGTFSRRGRAGFNQIPVSGSLFGRPLAPGRYAIVVESVRDGRRARIGRVLVTILARDGREGGSRPLATPECHVSGRTIVLLASGGGDLSELASVSPGSTGEGASATGSGSGSGSEPGGVAGVSAGRGGDDGDLPLLPELPALPALPTLAADDPFSLPSWWLPALGILFALGAATVVFIAFRRHRENSWSGWD